MFRNPWLSAVTSLILAAATLAASDTQACGRGRGGGGGGGDGGCGWGGCGWEGGGWGGGWAGGGGCCASLSAVAAGCSSCGGCAQAACYGGCGCDSGCGCGSGGCGGSGCCAGTALPLSSAPASQAPPTPPSSSGYTPGAAPPSTFRENPSQTPTPPSPGTGTTPSPSDVKPGGATSREVPFGRTAFSLKVPVDALVFVNDHPTKSKGSTRNYVSIGVWPGYTYDYRIRVEVIRDGKTQTSERTLRLTMGDDRDVDFTLPEDGSSLIASSAR